MIRLDTVLAVALAASAAAHAAPSTTSAYLRLMDLDRDGRVSLGEYQAWMAVGFSQMDSNGDGIVQVSEMPPSPRTRQPLTRAQHRKNVAATFDRQDANQDGYLSARELAAPPR